MKKIDCDGLLWYVLLVNRKLGNRLKKAIVKINNGFQLTPQVYVNGFILIRQAISVAVNKNHGNKQKNEAGIKEAKLCISLLFESPDKKQLHIFFDKELDSLKIITTKELEVYELKKFLERFCDYILKTRKKGGD